MKQMKSTPPVHINMYIKNLASCGGSAGRQYREKYTNHWDVYQLEPNKKKDKKYNMID